MPVINISKETMKLILWENLDNTEILVDDIIDNSRWSIMHLFIFKYTDGKIYETTYSIGATESQDERPWEYEDEVECVEVEPYEKMVIDYRRVRD